MMNASITRHELNRFKFLVNRRAHKLQEMAQTIADPAERDRLIAEAHGLLESLEAMGIALGNPYWDKGE